MNGTYDERNPLLAEWSRLPFFTESPRDVGLRVSPVRMAQSPFLFSRHRMTNLSDIKAEVSQRIAKDVAELKRLYIARSDELESCLPEGARSYVADCGCRGKLVRDEDYSEWQWDVTDCCLGCPE